MIELLSKPVHIEWIVVGPCREVKITMKRLANNKVFIYLFIYYLFIYLFTYLNFKALL